MSRRTHALVLPLVLIAVGGSLLAEQSWIAVKSRIAGGLIERAYAAHLRDGDLHRPWRWADTYPLARLEVPRLGIRRTVLAGASGSSLAFGPGHIDGTAAPGAPGNCAIAGHRDSWFAFLSELREGDEIALETRSGRRRYRVEELAVRTMWETEVLEPTRGDRLTLITCHPFDGIAGSTDRYIVRCIPLDSGPLG